MTNPPGHLWREKWTALCGPLSETTRDPLCTSYTRCIIWYSHLRKKQNKGHIRRDPNQHGIFLTHSRGVTAGEELHRQSLSPGCFRGVATRKGSTTNLTASRLISQLIQGCGNYKGIHLQAGFLGVLRGEANKKRLQQAI